MAARTTITSASAIQYSTKSRSCRDGAMAMTMADGRLVPEPPPSNDTCEAMSRNTSATIQVPIAK